MSPVHLEQNVLPAVPIRHWICSLPWGLRALCGKALTLVPRPAMAHPRGLAITNNGDANDDDENVYATEWFAQRDAPESSTG
ncbi:MAG: hypothetical protein EXR75_11555, partial [Myxococcales bacterium]|nr:hypothetical protein [Myxococcales bacterium]